MQGSTLPDNLYGCWHPVSYAHEVSAEAPLSVTLLDEPVVVWRTTDGIPRAMRDVCIHRGTALSLAGSRMTASSVPTMPGNTMPRAPVCTSRRASTKRYRPRRARPCMSASKGMASSGCRWPIPIYALPEIPELEDGDWKVVNTGPFSWASDASRQVENFTDFGHFPWVHPGLLGDPSRPLVPDHDVEIRGHVLHYEVVRPEAANSDDFPVFANDDIVKPERHSLYELHLPYTIVLRLGWGGSKGMVYFFASQPISQKQCRGYCIIGRNYDLDEPDTVLQDFEATIFGQDQVIVESQRPDQVPFDLADELHLKFDAVAVNYRRAMQQQGLAYTHLLDVVDD